MAKIDVWLVIFLVYRLLSMPICLKTDDLVFAADENRFWFKWSAGRMSGKEKAVASFAAEYI